MPYPTVTVTIWAVEIGDLEGGRRMLFVVVCVGAISGCGNVLALGEIDKNRANGLDHSRHFPDDFEPALEVVEQLLVDLSCFFITWWWILGFVAAGMVRIWVWIRIAFRKHHAATAVDFRRKLDIVRLGIDRVVAIEFLAQCSSLWMCLPHFCIGWSGLEGHGFREFRVDVQPFVKWWHEMPTLVII